MLMFSNDCMEDARVSDGQVGWLDLVAAAQQHGAFHGVFQFAHVAGPGILHHLLHGGRREAGHLLAIARAILTEKVRGQQRNVFAAVAQRGQMDLDGVEAEEQVLAEVAGG